MYNYAGSDDCYAKIDCTGMTNSKIVTTLCKMVDFCESARFSDFEKEFTCEHGIVYGYDGIGIFIAKDESSWELLYKEWAKEYAMDFDVDCVLCNG